MNIKTLLYTGILIPIVFWGATIICGFIHGHYNHLTGTVSELGAIGSPSEPLMATLTMFGAILSMFFMMGVYGACKQLGLNIIPVFTLPAFTFMMGWAAMFHSGNHLHSATGPVFFILYLGALLVAVLWRGKKELVSVRISSLLGLAFMLLIFLRFVPAIENTYPGLIQRFAHLGWSVWFTGLSIGLIRLVSLQENQQLLNH
ncbi:DUF998 domain-containing protein [Mucilaginibacter sp. RCC_168]|uniref:DUF998 domain-containing protein n=1 Tax=Mucilaginibacter sp. RCC_168 TaxID=3239221 RepID=UPI0035237598